MDREIKKALEFCKSYCAGHPDHHFVVQIIDDAIKVINDMESRIEELEGQYAYECGCNEELVDTQEENERLKKQLAECCRQTAKDIFEFVEGFLEWDEEMLVSTLKDYIEKKYGSEGKQ